MIRYNPKATSYEYETGEYPARWSAPISGERPDGDTIHLMYDKGTRGYQREAFRIAGINACELNDKDPEKRARAVVAKVTMAQFVKNLPGEWPLRIVVKKGKSFDRWVADVYFMRDGIEQNLAAELLALGVVDPIA